MQNPLLIATVLTVAALVCLAVGARLLMASGDNAAAEMSGTDGGKLVGILTLIGGAVVFLLSTVAILAARRYAVTVSNQPTEWSGQLELSSVQTWSDDLVLLRDDLRREGDNVDEDLVVDFVEIEVPAAWRAKSNYLVDGLGQPQDPLAELKHTRDQLMDAATRVDDIVQSINEITTLAADKAATSPQRSRWWRW